MPFSFTRISVKYHKYKYKACSMRVDSLNTPCTFLRVPLGTCMKNILLKVKIAI